MAKQQANDSLRDNFVFLDLTSLLCHGYILSLFTINFLFFKYALPLLGCCILFYGCHLVHTQNPYFKRANIIAFLRLLLVLLNFLVEWTTFYSNQWMILFQMMASFLLVTLFFYNLNYGFLCLYKKAGLSTYSHVLLKYLLFYWTTLAATFMVYETGVFGALMAILILLFNILFIIHAFRTIGRELAATDYEIKLTHMTPPLIKRIATFTSLYLCFLGFIIFLSNKGALFEANFTELDKTTTVTLSELEQKLSHLGMKEELLQMLSKYPDELNEYQSAQILYQNEGTYHINGGTMELSIYNVKRSNDYRMIVYYHWPEPPQTRLYHILECQSTSFQNVGNIQSYSYYDHKQLKTSFQLTPVKLGINTQHYPFVNQKIPNEGSNLRGFFAFTYSLSQTPSDSTPVTILLNYYYQTSILNLPHISIMDYMNNYELYKSNLVYNRLSIPLVQSN